MNIEGLFETLIKIINNEINELKQEKEKMEREKYIIKSKKLKIEQFIKLIKTSNKFKTTQIINYYHTYIKEIMHNDKYILIKNTNECEKIRLIAHNMYGANGKNFSNELISALNIYLKSYEKEIEKYNTTNYKNNINTLKQTLKSIYDNTYNKTIEESNKLIEFIEIDKNLNDDEKEYLIDYIKQTTKENIEYKKESIIDNEYKKNNKSIYLKVPKKEKNIEIKKEEKLNLFDDDDLELIKEIKNIIYTNLPKINYIDDNYAKFLNECLNLSNDELQNMELFDNNKTIEQYKKNILLYNLKQKIEELQNLEKLYDSLNKSIVTNNKISKEKEILLIELNNIYLEYKNTALDIVLQTNSFEEKNNNKKPIIYLVTNSGNVCFKSSIKPNKIKEEYYSSILNMLDELENGIINGNKEKDNVVTNNKSVGKIYKKKSYKTRILYLPYKNFIIVLTAYIKKTNDNNYYSNKLKLFSSRLNKILPTLEEAFNDPIKKEKIIEENKIIHNEIKEYLHRNSRGYTKIK